MQAATIRARRWLAAEIGCAAVAGIAAGGTRPLLALILDRRGHEGTVIVLGSASQSIDGASAETKTETIM